MRMRAAVLAASSLLCACALALLAATLVPTAAPASPGSVEDLEAQARSVRREVARLDHRAEVLTEKYNVARAALDAVNVRLQEARRDLERAQRRSSTPPRRCAARGSRPCTRATATACSTCSST